MPFAPANIPEALLRIIERLDGIYKEPEIVVCPNCGMPWGIRLERRRKYGRLFSIECGNLDCGKMFFS